MAAIRLDLQHSRFRDFPAEGFTKPHRIVGVKVSVVASAGYCHIGQPPIHKFFSSPLSVHMDKHAVSFVRHTKHCNVDSLSSRTVGWSWAMDLASG